LHKPSFPFESRLLRGFPGYSSILQQLSLPFSFLYSPFVYIKKLCLILLVPVVSFNVIFPLIGLTLFNHLSQLKKSVNDRLRAWHTTKDVEVNRNVKIKILDDVVGIPVNSTINSTGAKAYHISWSWHLFVYHNYPF